MSKILVNRALGNVGCAALALLAGFVAATGVARAESGTARGSMALEGHCPVCMIEAKKWVAGDPRHQVVYDGKTYQFPSEKHKQMFQANPANYVPALGGDCTVCYAMSGKRIAGNIRQMSLHDGRLFLFPSAKEKETFTADPKRFANVDLALNGNCPVCRVMAGKDVPGKPEFTAIHQGLRYQFPSDKERQAFLSDPAKFVGKQTSAKRVSARQPASETITIKGKSTCAGCEHGVVPIGAPDELGLAVNAADGKVYVVEDAHKLYPDVYKGRFDGLPLEVSGTVLKRSGKIAWIKPTQLKVLN